MPLPEDAFLRRLPKALNSDQRLRLEALVLCADMMAAAADDLTKIASRNAKTPEVLSRTDRVAMFSRSWTIVDQAYAATQFLSALPMDSARIARFMAEAQPARLLRNKMDHLNANIENLAAREGRHPPVFGSLSYFVCEESQPPISGGKIITVTAGSLDGPKRVTMLNPGGKELAVPVSGFEFQAFDQRFSVEPLVNSLDAAVVEINDEVQKELLPACTALAAEHGISADDLLENYAEGLVLVVGIKF